MALIVASLIPYTAAAARAAMALRRLGKVGDQISKMAGQMKPASPKPTVKPEPKPVEPRIENPKDILSPNGKLYGRAGDKLKVREQDGGEKAARELYERGYTRYTT